jgi:hypothetical protein
MARGAIMSKPCKKYCTTFLNRKGSFGKYLLSEKRESIFQKYRKQNLTGGKKK